MRWAVAETRKAARRQFTHLDLYLASCASVIIVEITSAGCSSMWSSSEWVQHSVLQWAYSSPPCKPWLRRFTECGAEEPRHTRVPLIIISVLSKWQGVLQSIGVFIQKKLVLRAQSVFKEIGTITNGEMWWRGQVDRKTRHHYYAMLWQPRHTDKSCQKKCISEGGYKVIAPAGPVTVAVT